MYFDPYAEKEFLIRFDSENYRGVCGIAEDGHEVYMDIHSGVFPEHGDAWYCTLRRKDTEDNHYYVASPVYKVESRSVPLVEIPVIDAISKERSTADAPGGETANAIEIQETVEEFVPELAEFVAIGDDTIYSPRLTAARYTVYRSFNGEHYEIIPDSNGNIPCVRNSIALESLDDILGCEFPVRLDCTVKDDRILLNLTQ